MKQCRVCGVELADDNWSPSHLKNNNYICKDCDKKQKREYHETHREKVNAQKREYHETHKEKENA